MAAEDESDNGGFVWLPVKRFTFLHRARQLADNSIRSVEASNRPLGFASCLIDRRSGRQIASLKTQSVPQLPSVDGRQLGLVGTSLRLAMWRDGQVTDLDTGLRDITRFRSDEPVLNEAASSVPEIDRGASDR